MSKLRFIGFVKKIWNDSGKGSSEDVLGWTWKEMMSNWFVFSYLDLFYRSDALWILLAVTRLTVYHRAQFVLSQVQLCCRNVPPQHSFSYTSLSFEKRKRAAIPRVNSEVYKKGPDHRWPGEDGLALADVDLQPNIVRPSSVEWVGGVISSIQLPTNWTTNLRPGSIQVLSALFLFSESPLCFSILYFETRCWWHIRFCLSSALSVQSLVHGSSAALLAEFSLLTNLHISHRANINQARSKIFQSSFL